jgi:hypothetical protein
LIAPHIGWVQKPLVQVRPPLQRLPAQQPWLKAPHALQMPVVQTPVEQLTPLQQGRPMLPQGWLMQVPPLQTSPAAQLTPPQQA